MKKRILRFVVMMMTVILCVSAVPGGAYAETIVQQGGITQWDINQGLEACKLYPVKLTLDGKEIAFAAKDVPPVIIKERTLIPARALFEGMGGKVTWDNDTQRVLVSYDNTEVVLTIGSAQAVVNGAVKELEVPPLIIDHDGDYYGSTMIPVRFTAESLGCTVGWDDPTRSVTVQSPVKNEPPVDNSGSDNSGNSGNSGNNGNTNDNITGDSNGNTNGSNDNSWNSGNTNITWAYEQLNEAAKDKLVAIDMGHGGKDSGSIGHEGQADQLYEKTVNLAVGLKLNEYLQSAGVKTLMIRDSDVYYTLLERAQKANDAGATVFISVHNNSNESSTPHGTEVLYNSKVNAEGKTEAELYGIESKNIAKNVQSEMVKNLGTYDRGIKSSPAMAVLNKTSMPAIIVEGAFLSNENNFAMMKQSDYADKYALSVAKGIIKSLNEAFK